jgi:hypothetical protein
MRRVPIKLVVLVVGVAAVVAIPVAVTVHQSNQAAADWKAAHAIERVRGKSARDLVEMFGEPKSMVRDPPTGIVLNMVFEGPDANFCGVEFENDRAAKVTFWSR